MTIVCCGVLAALAFAWIVWALLSEIARLTSRINATDRALAKCERALAQSDRAFAEHLRSHAGEEVSA